MLTTYWIIECQHQLKNLSHSTDQVSPSNNELLKEAFLFNHLQAGPSDLLPPAAPL